MTSVGTLGSHTCSCIAHSHWGISKMQPTNNSPKWVNYRRNTCTDRNSINSKLRKNLFLLLSPLSPNACVQEQYVIFYVEVWYSVPVSQLSVGQGNEAGLDYVHIIKPSWHSPSHGAEDLCLTKAGDGFLWRFIQRMKIRVRETKVNSKDDIQWHNTDKY